MAQIELSPTVSSFEGGSDSGKSAALRAMLWALTNKPDGSAFASYWAKDAKKKIKDPVAVSIDNITRIRSEEFNGYIRYGANGEERYEALKGAVPVEIERAINIGPVNIQHQMDPPFLISQTPGEAARYLNALVGLEDIDSYQKALKGKSRDNSNSLKDENARLADAEKALSKYDWVDDAKKKVDTLEKICESATTLESDLAFLSLLDELARYDAAFQKKKLDSIESLIAAYPVPTALNADITMLSRLPALITFEKALARLSEEIKDATPRIEALSRIDTAALNFECNTLVTALSDIKGLTISLDRKTAGISAANALIERGMALMDCARAAEESMSQIIEVENLSALIQARTHDLIEASSALEGKACPICGKPL